MRALLLYGLIASACMAQPAVVQPPPRRPPAQSAAPAQSAPAPAAAPSALPPLPLAPSPVGFLKGQTHVHTNRSYDARTPPENVLRFYAERGYDFVALTDHNRVTVIAPPPGLLLIPGVELSQNSSVCDPQPTPGYRCLFHVSGLFVDPAKDARHGERLPLPFRPGRLEAYRSQLDVVRGLGAVPVLNHPLFHFAADARLIGALAEAGVRHVELFNASLDQQHPSGRKAAEARAEELWDEVLSQGTHVFGLATDDAHHFADSADRARVGKFAYVGDRAWIMLRAEKNPASIQRAFVAGDFYLSTGVTLSKLESARGALSVGISSVAGETYTIRFVGSRGRELGRVTGSEASQRLPAGPGYVRAVVEDSAGRKAWTQPLWAAP